MRPWIVAYARVLQSSHSSPETEDSQNCIVDGIEVVAVAQRAKRFRVEHFSIRALAHFRSDSLSP